AAEAADAKPGEAARAPAARTDRPTRPSSSRRSSGSTDPTLPAHPTAESGGEVERRVVVPAHGSPGQQPSVNRTAFMATAHSLPGCAIGEVLGLVIASAAGWGNAASIGLATVLAFVFGYSLTLRPL